METFQKDQEGKTQEVIDWLVDRARKKVVDSLRWRVFFAMMIMAGLLGLGWLVATWTVL